MYVFFQSAFIFTHRGSVVIVIGDTDSWWINQTTPPHSNFFHSIFFKDVITGNDSRFSDFLHTLLFTF